MMTKNEIEELKKEIDRLKEERSDDKKEMVSMKREISLIRSGIFGWEYNAYQRIRNDLCVKMSELREEFKSFGNGIEKRKFFHKMRGRVAEIRLGKENYAVYTDNEYSVVSRLSEIWNKHMCDNCVIPKDVIEKHVGSEKNRIEACEWAKSMFPDKIDIEGGNIVFSSRREKLVEKGVV